MRRLSILLFAICALIQCSRRPGEAENLYEQWRVCDVSRSLALWHELFDAMLRDPIQFYEMFQEDSSAFRRFVDLMPSGEPTSLRRNYDISKLEETRQAALTRLHDTPVPEAYQGLHQRILAKLEQATPRYSAKLGQMRDAWLGCDGEACLTIGAQLFDELLLDPAGFYAAFCRDATGFYLFLERLPATTFTNFDDGNLVPELENKRQDAIARLRSAVIPREFQRMHYIVLDKLEQVRPRNVDEPEAK